MITTFIILAVIAFLVAVGARTQTGQRPVQFDDLTEQQRESGYRWVSEHQRWATVCVVATLICVVSGLVALAVYVA